MNIYIILYYIFLPTFQKQAFQDQVGKKPEPSYQEIVNDFPYHGWTWKAC